MKLCAIAVMTALGLLTSSLQADEPATISLSGTGTVQAQPDEGYITLGVNSKADTSAVAVRNNTQSMQKVYTALEALGIQKKDIHTQEFSVRQNFRYEKDDKGNRNAVPDGFIVSNMVRITVCELDKFGEVLDAVTQSGANTVHGISFGSSKADELLDQARARAVADALEKAKIYAEGLGVNLGDVLRVTESGASSIHLKYSMAASVAETNDVPVSGGSLSFSMSVSVVWEIENEPHKPRFRIKLDSTKVDGKEIKPAVEPLNKREINKNQ